MKRVCAVLLMSSFAFSNCAARGPSLSRQRVADPPELWRMYAEKLPIGSVVTIGTSDGDHFSASLLIVDDTGITVKPKTRVPEPVRHVTFDRLEQLELERENSGPANRAGAIGVGIGAGAGTFFGLLLAYCAAHCGG
jgi:hypothetical protein